MRPLLLSLAFFLFACPAPTPVDDDDASPTPTATPAPPQVLLTTDLGAMTITLNESLAPITVANFLAYVDQGFFDGDDGLEPTHFHRVIPGFMIQGGGLTEAMQPKTTLSAIVNESDNGLSNLRGTLAMARTNSPDSATSQFFINLVDNEFLDIDGDYPPGYAVFGQVTEGMDVVDTIAAQPTETAGPYEDVPVDRVTITDCARL